ncbi:glycosyltransferase family 4 protein [Patescibacteria group bacterium]|nr:glycosyltransferase family 4 protein [Patescibacteria group bacterium]
MVVGIDLRPLVSGKRTGVEEYVLQLLDSLFTKGSGVRFKLFFNGYNTVQFPKSFFERFDNVELIEYSIPNKLFNFSLHYFNYPKIDKLLKSVDVFFMPNILFEAVSDDAKKIVTFHDLSFEHFKEFLTTKRRLWHIFVNPQKIARGADCIVAVSDSTKHDIIETYNIDHSKVHTIHSGIIKKASEEKVTRAELREKYQLPKKYILFMGTIEPRKNLPALIEAFSAVSKKLPEYSLVVAGAPGWKMREMFTSYQERGDFDKIHFTGFIDPEDKDALFEAASVFVYPSFYEGFGFPLLEAAEAGTPIIAGAHSSIFEIIGNAALLIDPCNVYELSEALYTMLTSPEVRNRLTSRANKRLSMFSVEETAKRMLRLITEYHEKKQYSTSEERVAI